MKSWNKSAYDVDKPCQPTRGADPFRYQGLALKGTLQGSFEDQAGA